jgi:hypothetical protein
VTRIGFGGPGEPPPIRPKPRDWNLSPAEMLAALWKRVHKDCEPAWYCTRCERPVCPSCDPSPMEKARRPLCKECHWLYDDGGAA